MPLNADTVCLVRTQVQHFVRAAVPVSRQTDDRSASPSASRTRQCGATRRGPRSLLLTGHEALQTPASILRGVPHRRTKRVEQGPRKGPQSPAACLWMHVPRVVPVSPCGRRVRLGTQCLVYVLAPDRLQSAIIYSADLWRRRGASACSRPLPTCVRGYPSGAILLAVKSRSARSRRSMSSLAAALPSPW